MYTGQIAQISNKATWRSDVIELVDEDDDTVTDLSDPSLTVDIVVTICEMPRTRPGCCDDYGTPTVALVTASVEDGQVAIVGPGFFWQFEVEDLQRLCPKTYRLGVKITIDDFVVDEIIGTIAVIEGN